MTHDVVLGEADRVHDEAVLVTLHLADVRRLFRCRMSKTRQPKYRGRRSAGTQIVSSNIINTHVFFTYVDTPPKVSSYFTEIISSYI